MAASKFAVPPSHRRRARAAIFLTLILVLGLAIAFVWTAVLRVGSQVSLILAPIATLLLVLGWAHVRLPGSDREIVPNRTYIERPRTESGSRLPQLAQGANRNGAVTRVEFRDERNRVEELPPAPRGLPRALDTQRLEDPTMRLSR